MTLENLGFDFNRHFIYIINKNEQSAGDMGVVYMKKIL